MRNILIVWSLFFAVGCIGSNTPHKPHPPGHPSRSKHEHKPEAATAPIKSATETAKPVKKAPACVYKKGTKPSTPPTPVVPKPTEKKETKPEVKAKSKQVAKPVKKPADSC